jgi:putative GTP pyrophosphokinase
MIEQEAFLLKYNIDSQKFIETTIEWSELESIFDDYISHIPKLEQSANFIFNMIMKAPGVHSVRYRVKNPEHLIAKIIRKRIENNDRIIDLTNYQLEVTDLIGVRALHLFKDEWKPIHNFILDQWDVTETPVAYFRTGDSIEYLKQFSDFGVDTKEHRASYRSIHYTVSSKPSKQTHFAEIQVRTIYEEAWSEIDHKIRYPNETDNALVNQFLLILNRLSGSADEMGTFVSNLKLDIEQQFIERSERDKIHQQDIIDKNQEISELKTLINNTENPDRNAINEKIDKIFNDSNSENKIKGRNSSEYEKSIEHMFDSNLFSPDFKEKLAAAQSIYNLQSFRSESLSNYSSLLGGTLAQIRKMQEGKRNENVLNIAEAISEDGQNAREVVKKNDKGKGKDK